MSDAKHWSDRRYAPMKLADEVDARDDFDADPDGEQLAHARRLLETVDKVGPVSRYLVERVLRDLPYRVIMRILKERGLCK